MRSLVPAAVAATFLACFGCSPDKPNKLDKMHRAAITINEARFDAWVADNEEERERGLMFVGPEEMADLPDGAHRAMLFVFDYDQYLSFWMKNTIIPLDIAYIDSDGVIVSIHTMAPLDTRSGQYQSATPARYALEVNANLLGELGIKKGDQVVIPDLKPPL